MKLKTGASSYIERNPCETIPEKTYCVIIIATVTIA
jgi:hypothetical protein